MRLALMGLLVAAAAACRREPPPPPPPAPPAAAALAPDAAPTAEEGDQIDQGVEREYQAGLLEYDRKQLALFDQVLARVDRALADYEAVATRMKTTRGPAAKKAIDLAVKTHDAAAAALLARVDALDATRSSMVSELQVLLHEVRTGYPDALRQLAAGRDGPVGDKRTAVAERRAEIDRWLAQARSPAK